MLNTILKGAVCTIWLAGLAVRSASPQIAHLGKTIPDFALQDRTGQMKQFPAARGKIKVVVFIANRCPMSNAFNSRLNDLYNGFKDRIEFIVINSNSNESSDDVNLHAQLMGYDFPVYKDVGNTVADLFGAQSTPDSFVVDRTGAISYHGYIEDAPNPARTKNHALRLAIEAALDNRSAPVPETHARGCAIRRSGDR